MKIIHTTKELTSAFKDAVLNNDCIRMAVFMFDKQKFSEICGLKNDDFLKLQDKLVCIYTTSWHDDETIEGVTESIKGVPVYFINTQHKRFHPKVFLFTNREKSEWKAIVSSANITSGFDHYIQSSVLLSQDDDDEEHGLRKNLEDYFEYLKNVETATKVIKKELKLKSENQINQEFILSVSCFLDTVEPLLDKELTLDRRWIMFKRFMNGEAYKDIAKDFGLSGERIRQLAKRGASKFNGSIRKINRKGEVEKFSCIRSAHANMRAIIEEYDDNSTTTTSFFKARLTLLEGLKKTMDDGKDAGK